jgi:hypothetical protein
MCDLQEARIYPKAPNSNKCVRAARVAFREWMSIADLGGFFNALRFLERVSEDNKEKRAARKKPKPATTLMAIQDKLKTTDKLIEKCLRALKSRGLPLFSFGYFDFGIVKAPLPIKRLLLQNTSNSSRDLGTFAHDQSLPWDMRLFLESHKKSARKWKVDCLNKLHCLDFPEAKKEEDLKMKEEDLKKKEKDFGRFLSGKFICHQGKTVHHIQPTDIVASKVLLVNLKWNPNLVQLLLEYLHVEDYEWTDTVPDYVVDYENS